MRRTVSLVAVVLLAGCGPAGEPERLDLAAGPAEPQRATLGWRESFPPQSHQVRDRLVFSVGTLEVRREGWSVEIAITNASTFPYEAGGTPPELSYGLMLFREGSLEALDEANRAGRLPAIRRAATIEPAPPQVLRPRQTWRATLSAPGSLADGSWVRVTFGPLHAQEDPPGELPADVLWITDHARKI